MYGLLWPMLFAILALTAGCQGGTRASEEPEIVADVVAVSVEGKTGGYTFRVGIESPDTGCSQYANWWEVVSEDGLLLYRRVLGHSHVAEQPFLRTGGPVAIAADTVVWVRAHMHPTGYGGTAFRGSAAAGFRQTASPGDFAAELADAAPLPDGCAG